MALIAPLALAILLAPLAAAAPQAGKLYRVGILGESASDSTEARLHQALGLGLQERGWIEGENLLIELRWTEGTQLGSRNSRPTWFGARWT